MRKKKQKSGENAETTMTLSGHLKELRHRLTAVFVVLIAAFGICLANAGWIIERLTAMGEEYGYTYVYISPQELLMQHFAVSLVFALVVCIPFIAWQIWRFVQPGLTKSENTAFCLSLIFGMIFFCIGVYFAYRISLPYILYFLIHISEGSEITAQISVQNYITFLMTVFIVFGFVFELPVVSVILTGIGIIKSIWLRKARKVAVVLIFVLSAIITPPDVVSQVMVAFPMLILFQMGIWLSMIVEKLKRKKKTDKPENEGDDEEESEEEDSGED